MTAATGRGAEARFSSAALAARAVALCGWAAGDAGLDVAGAVLAPGEVVVGPGSVARAWTSAERPDPARPLGPPRSVVVLRTADGAVVRIAMGSHAWVPTETADPPAWRVTVRPDEQLVVDGRCAYRVEGGEVSAELRAAG